VRDRRSKSTPTRRAIASLALCTVGLGLSGYTLDVHFQPQSLVCVNAGPFDCGAVLTSAQSVIFGIPVPFFGIAFFLGLGMLCLPFAWRSAEMWVHWARLAVTVVGIGMVMYLIVTELFTVKKICLWCTGVHVVTFLLFAIVVTGMPALLAQDG
jgi:uncharacterized membrane protein